MGFKDLAEEYFKECELKGERPRVVRLALATGLSGKKELFSLLAKEDVRRDVEIALSIVEDSYEEMLADRHPSGAIFALKSNFGWKDKEPAEETSGDIAAAIGAAIKVLKNEKNSK